MKKTVILFSLILCVNTFFLLAQKTSLIIQLGHSNTVTSLDFSSDNKLLVSGSLDNTVKIWDVASGKLLHTFEGHSHAVSSVKFSSDNNFVVSSSFDKTVKIWDISAKVCLHTLSGHSMGVNDVCINSNGKIVASAGSDLSIKLWNTNSGELLMSIDAHERTITSLKFSPDGKNLISASLDGTIKIWNIANGKIVKSINGHKEAVTKITISPDGKYIGSLSDDKTMKIWNYATGNELHSINGISSATVFSPDSKQFICAGDDIKFIDIESGQIIKSLLTDNKRIKAIAISSNNQTLAVADGSKINFINTNNDKIVQSLTGFSKIVTSVSFSFDNKSLLISSQDKTIKLMDMETGRFIRKFKGHSNIVESAVFRPYYDKQIISAGRDNQIKLWDIVSGENIKTYNGHTDDVTSISFRIDGNYFASGSKDKTVKLWKTQTGENVRTYKGHEEMVHSVSVSFDGKYIASGSWDGTIKIWDVEENKLLKTLKGHKGDVWSVCFSPNGKYIVSGSLDKTIKLWETNTGKNIETFTGHDDYVKSVCFSPNGDKIASGSWDKTIKIWNLKGKLLQTLTGHLNYIRSVAFSPDGKHLVSGGTDTQTKIWNLSTGKEMLNLVVFENGKDYVVTTPSGYFDGTDTGIKKALHYVHNGQIIPLESFFEKFYIPNLWARVMSGENLVVPDVDIDNDLKLPPLVKIVSPENNLEINDKNTESRNIEITIKATDFGDGIDEIRLYHNGKLVNTTERGFKPDARNGESKFQTFSVTLVNGINKFKTVAFNKQRTESFPDYLLVTYGGEKATANLYVLTIGINNYKNEIMNLNYAKSDAQAFIDGLQTGAKTIFDQIIPISISDSNATKENILYAFEQITENATENDLFVFYYAGHGVMSSGTENIPSSFYLIPYNITQLYGADDKLATGAISSEQLTQLSQKIKAQKQLIILDACQSGGAVDVFATRGVAEQKAIMQLARSAGITLLAASGSEQYASEFKDLGHGVFTYAILEALTGKADGGKMDKKITVSEIKSYIEERVPELTQKYRGQTQYPTGYSRGQDFPVTIY